MIKKLERYFKNEYQLIRDIPDTDAKWSTVQRCLGAASFAQLHYSDKLDYIELEELFNYYKAKIMGWET